MKSFKLLIMALIASTLLTTLHAQTKRYETKSGIIEYQITQSGNMMGVSIEGNGTAKTLFKEWGNVELHTEEILTTTMGQKEREQTMTKVDNGQVFVVDFDEKVIYRYTPEMLKNSEYQEIAKSAQEMLSSMGGKKIGEEEFIGYKCEIWQMMHVKLWIHKGIMLKTEADMMGIKSSTVATKIELDVDVSDADLKLPDFPMKDAQMNRMPGGVEEDGEVPQLTPEQMQQMQEMIKSFSQK